MRRCEKAVTLPEPFWFAQCVEDAGHEGDHRAVLDWDDDDLESAEPES